MRLVACSITGRAKPSEDIQLGASSFSKEDADDEG